MTAKIIDEFPSTIREVEHAWIPLADGTRLAARYWLPDDAESNPVPGILEYIPYRKRDGTAARDEAMPPFFAGHGYAAVRVDMRGSGESDGLLHEEYLKREQDDALEVIAWIAEQPWCTGRVGMMGKSWGGFNALQVAARRPPALSCIITVYSTDDRYADDIHYMGGCLLTANPDWAFTMFGQNGRPPDPLLVGERWRETWLARLENNRPWIIEWLRHQRRDDFWRHGSVCEDYAAIECPVYAIGGWADPYTNPVPRLLANLTAPRKAAGGSLGPPVPAPGASGAHGRFHERGTALVGPLVEGHRQRHHGRAAIPDLDARQRATGRQCRRGRGPLDRRAGVAIAQRRHAPIRAQRGWPVRRRRTRTPVGR